MELARQCQSPEPTEVRSPANRCSYRFGTAAIEASNISARRALRPPGSLNRPGLSRQEAQGLDLPGNAS